MRTHEENGIAILKEEDFVCLVNFWFGTFAMHFSTTGCVFRHKNIWRWTI